MSKAVRMRFVPSDALTTFTVSGLLAAKSVVLAAPHDAAVLGRRIRALCAVLLRS